MVSCWEITAIRDHMNLVMRVTIPFTMAASEEAMRRKVENILLSESSGLVDTGEIWREGEGEREKRKGEEEGRRGREKRKEEEAGREKRKGEEGGREERKGGRRGREEEEGGRKKREGEEGGRRGREGEERGREKRKGGSKGEYQLVDYQVIFTLSLTFSHPPPQASSIGVQLDQLATPTAGYKPIFVPRTSLSLL